MENFTIRRGSEQFGPYQIEEIRKYYSAGRLLPTDLVWREAAAAWEPLTGLIGEAPPPPPPQSAPPPLTGPNTGINRIDRDYPNEPPRYQRAFKKFDANGGKFTSSLNVWAFLFGPFWYFYKGMWKKALLYIGIAFAAEIVLGDIGPWAIPVICMILGNFDYYLFRTQQKDFGW